MKRIYTLLLLISMTLTISAQSDRYAKRSQLSVNKWVKIRVGSEGVYQLSKNLLAKMGFTKPVNVRLYGYNRPVLPEAGIEDIEDDLVEIPLYRNSKTGHLLFYSKGTTEWKRTSETSMNFSHFNNPYSKYVYYFVTGDTFEDPAAFETVNAQTTATMTQKTFYNHSIIDKDEYSFINCGRTFFESYDFATGASKSYSLPLPQIASSDIELTVKFGAAGSNASSLTVNAAGKQVGTMSFSKLRDYEYASVSENTFKILDYSGSQAMTVRLQHTHQSGTSGHLDYIKACYECPLSLTGDYLAFGPLTSGDGVFEISGADANTSVWNVTSPSLTCELKGTLNGQTYKVLSEDMELNDMFVAVNTAKTFPTPEIVGTVANQDLHSLSDIDLLIIVPANGKLTGQAQRLADAHTQYDGIKCQVVTADKVYNEFSSGTPDATAYRRIMKMLYDKAQGSGTAPSNLLLFGECLWDNRFVTKGLTKNSQDDYLLVYESDNSWSHTQSYPLEEYFALLADGKGAKPVSEAPDAGVGRIPVTTASEAKDVVDKLIAYITNKEAGSWRNTICFMADDGNTENDQQEHAKYAERIIGALEPLYPAFRYKRIYWDSYTRQQTSTGSSYPDVTREIDRTVKDGALIMNYTGHGSSYCLSHEQVLRTENFKGWDSPRLPLWLTAACDVAPFDMNTENLAKEALVNRKGGAIGFIGTARTVYGNHNYTLNNSFMKYVLGSTNGKRNTIGFALAKAKADALRGSAINKSQFILLGDPALILPNPTYRVKIDKFNGADINTGNEERISAGAVVEVEGHIEDGDGNPVETYNGIISPAIFDSKELVRGKNNLGFIDPDDVFEYYDYTRKLYEGADSIRNGQFRFTFPVPLDNNYSNSNGLINLYAINSDKTAEANGKFTQFTIGGTETEIANDTIGPDIATFINSDHTIDGQKVNETPTIYIHLKDDSGINATGNGLGHDIVAIVDGRESTTYNLNNYYVQNTGDYTSGKIEYTMPELEAGKHTLTVRAFDTLNNFAEKNYSFEVFTGLKKVIEMYDFTGRLITADKNQSLPKGSYIQKTRYMSEGKEVTHETKKVLVR